MVHTSLFLVPFLSILQISVRACEGPCIVQITKAFVGNYSIPVQHAFDHLAQDIARISLPPHSTAAASRRVAPLLNAYRHDAYDAMEKSIFPGFFHGKCQVNGIEPPGCPNPDCPVVCGTPGSLVHFYEILKQVAFNATASNLAHLCSSSSKAYNQFEIAVADERRQKKKAYRRYVVDAATRTRPSAHGNETADEQIRKQIISTCMSTVRYLEEECGGMPKLPKCSWETNMKAFILSFP